MTIVRVGFRTCILIALVYIHNTSSHLFRTCARICLEPALDGHFDLSRTFACSHGFSFVLNEIDLTILMFEHDASLSRVSR